LLAAGLTKNTTLRTLDLRSNNLLDDSASHLAECVKHSGLSKVDVSNNAFTSHASRLLAAALSEDNLLQELILDDNKLGAKGATRLGVALANNTRLTSLSLRNNDLGPQGCQGLAEMFPHVPNPLFGQRAAPPSSLLPPPASSVTTCVLKVLNISGNKIGDGGIGVLCQKLRRNQHLQTLDLALNDLQEGAAEDIADMLALNASLTSVNLQRNKLRSAGMVIISKALGKNDTLTCLNLRDNCLDDLCVQELARGMRSKRSMIDLDFDENAFNFGNINFLNQVLAEHKAAYVAATPLRLSKSLSQRWSALTRLPELLAKGADETSMAQEVTRNLAAVRAQRVQEAEEADHELETVLQELAAAKLTLERLESSESEAHRETLAVKKSSAEQIDRQTKVLEKDAADLRRIKSKQQELDKLVLAQGPLEVEEAPEILEFKKRLQDLADKKLELLGLPALLALAQAEHHKRVSPSASATKLKDGAGWGEGGGGGGGGAGAGATKSSGGDTNQEESPLNKRIRTDGAGDQFVRSASASSGRVQQYGLNRHYPCHSPCPFASVFCPFLGLGFRV